MKFNKFGTVLSAIAAATVLNLLDVATAAAATLQLIGLNDSNTLVFFNNNFSQVKKTVGVTGVDGTLLGIDFRPADRQLYGISSTNKIYTIDSSTGAATFVSTLSLPFSGGIESGVDFNPVVDRLRLVASNDQNFRLNVDTGAVADFDSLTPGTQPDGNLAYAAGDANEGANPSITAAAYTNSFAGAPSPTRTTQLFGIDADLDTLVLQSPPNNGTLTTIGSLGIDFGSTGGFDIFSPASGANTAYAASGSNIYNINLTTGAATTLGTFSSADSGNIVGLAATQVPEPVVTSSLIGFGLLGLFRRRRSVKSLS